MFITTILFLNLNHWLLEKSEMINLQMLIQKNTFNVLSSCCPFEKKHAQQCLPRFLWRGRHIGTCESLGSSPVKMSKAFPQPFDLLQLFILPPKG